MKSNEELLAQAELVVANFRRRGLTLLMVESCTGGLAAACLTEIPGASDVVEGGFVTYSNHAKTAMADVPAELIEKHGAVSEEVARAMSEGSLRRMEASVAVSITGVAGPSGGSPEKPVGLVHLAAARQGAATLHVERRFGDLGRKAIRLESVAAAFDLALEIAAG
jgi:nicotinamide-nucleotide amidase